MHVVSEVLGSCPLSLTTINGALLSHQTPGGWHLLGEWPPKPLIPRQPPNRGTLAWYICQTDIETLKVSYNVTAGYRIQSQLLSICKGKNDFLKTVVPTVSYWGPIKK